MKIEFVLQILIKLFNCCLQNMDYDPTLMKFFPANNPGRLRPRQGESIVKDFAKRTQCTETLAQVEHFLSKVESDCG